MRINSEVTTADISAGAGVAQNDEETDDSPDSLSLTKNRKIDVARSKAAAAAMVGMAMPDGTFRITNASELMAAIKQIGIENVSKYSLTEVRQFIVKRARQLNMVSLLPPVWGISMEFILDTTTSDTGGVTGTAARKKEAKSGVARKDGSYPIPNTTYLKKAIRAYGRSKPSERSAVKAHIIRRAKALGASSMLPEGWVSAEEMKPEEETEIKFPEIFESILILEGDLKPIVLEQTEEQKVSGTLRVRMPFYVGESIAKPPGIPRRVYFPTGLLSETIAEGKKQIAEGKQPLTVYARHAHAIDASHLPMGSIVNLEQEGRIGYVTLEIEPTTYGKDAQILLQAKPPKLNAVSLRSGPKRFELEDVQVNGELMFKPTKLLLDGVDFAPDSPAMATYGLEILAAEASIESVVKNKKEVIQQVEDITLEAVRAKPEIVEEIEKPLLKRLDQEIKKTADLTLERDALKEQATRNDLNVFVADMASKHPKKDEVLAVFMELAKDCKTKDEFSSKILPYFVNAAASMKPIAPSETLDERIKKLFPTTPSVTLENEAEPEEEVNSKSLHVGALEVPE